MRFHQKGENRQIEAEGRLKLGRKIIRTLNMQWLLFDLCIVFVCIMLLFIIMSNLFFKPVRAFLEQRKAGIAADIEAAKADEAAVESIKAEYEALLKEANKEAESLISTSFKNALKKQDEMISEAKEKAQAVIEQADREVEKDKAELHDDVKRQMTEMASVIAGKFVISGDPFREALLLEETLKEMGGDTWQNS